MKRGGTDPMGLGEGRWGYKNIQNPPKNKKTIHMKEELYVRFNCMYYRSY